MPLEVRCRRYWKRPHLAGQKKKRRPDHGWAGGRSRALAEPDTVPYRACSVDVGKQSTRTASVPPPVPTFAPLVEGPAAAAKAEAAGVIDSMDNRVSRRCFGGH
jgi:hypothetical protein